MSKFILKIVKLGLWVLVPTLFISGTKLDDHLTLTSNVDGDYTMQVTGNLNNKLSGAVSFETATATTSKGISFSTLKLKLDNKESGLPHSMEFLISKENTFNLLPIGTYKVLRNQEGFLNYFDGVFGFANINALGELPLFAQNGDDGRKINFPDIPGYKTLLCDFHQHTVFSDGSVWPNIRVQEALK